MFRLVIFHQRTAGGTNIAFTPVAALPDPHVTVVGNNIQVPPDTLQLALVYGFGGSYTAGNTAVISNIRIQAPSLSPFIDVPSFETPAGGIAGDHEPGSPYPLNIYVRNNIWFVPTENLQVHTRESVTGNDRQSTILVFLGDGNYELNAALAGKMIETVRATASFAHVPFQWTNGSLTFEQQLKAGTYAVVGMKHISASSIAARLLFTGQGARPGVVGADAKSDIQNRIFRNGNLGVWGYFTHNAPPTLDVFSRAAVTFDEVFLDVIKV